MFLSDLSIKQPVFATMMMAALAVLGITSYRTLKVDLFPDVEFPVVTVTTRYAGASPETVERAVTRTIEESVNTVEGVRHIESSSQEGISSLIVQFDIGVPTLNASQDIRGKVAAIRGELPREIDEPIIQRIDPSAAPIVSVAVDAPALTPRAVSDIADKLVKRRLENVPGVGAVNLVGEAKREIQVVVDRTRLEAYGLSLAQVVDALRTQNIDAPAGTADRGATEAMVRVAAQGRSAAEIGAIPVKHVGDRTLVVRDVAQVIDGVEEARSLAFVNERPAIALDVQKQAGANTVAVADGVKAAVAATGPELPPGVSLQVVRDDSTFIRDSIEDVQTTLILGGFLTVFIVFLFLNSWRSTLITALQSS
jgi:HAE1 family hydrophobic/amphiphilic exporter-1